MAWIESHQELARHPKTLKLASMLDVSVPAVIGHLHMLWWWAMDYAPDGDLSEYDQHDLAVAAGWDGDPDAFAAALVDCGPGASAGFVDDDHSLHDWDEYGGKLHAKREQDAARKRAARAARAAKKSAARPDDATPTSDARPADIDTPSEPRPTDVPRTSNGRDADVRVAAHVEDRTGQDRTEEDPAAAAEPSGPTEVTAVVDVDDLPVPMPVGCRGGPLTDEILAWAVEVDLRTGAPPRKAWDRAQAAVRIIVECLGDGTDATRPMVAVVGDYAADVTGRQLSGKAWGIIRSLVRDFGAEEALRGLQEGTTRGAGLNDLDPSEALCRYASGVIRGQDAA